MIPKVRAIRTLFLACAILVIVAQTAVAERVALVIGNSAYMNVATLPNAANDASDMAARLTEIGFAVHSGENLTQAQTLALVEEFAKSLHPEDVALFFYSGHGVQIGTENYIIPVDADATDEPTLIAASVKLQAILRTMELRADRRIVILDACRNNPFTAKLVSRGIAENSVSRGLAKVEAGVGSFIVFSTQPGNVALDGTGRNSPFTTALLKHIGVAGEDIHGMMLKVRADVVAATGETQVPWENSSLVDEVYLAGGNAVEPTPQPTAQPETNTAQRVVAEPKYYYVDGLDPNGDGFLALRTGTSGDAPRLMKMPEGTKLELLGTDGVWYHVRLLDGQEGWAHSRWISCCTTGNAQPAPPVKARQSCDDLWTARNAIWAGYGYCFTSARGKSTFGNAGCSRNQAQVQAAMSPQDRTKVDQLRADEATQGCP